MTAEPDAASVLDRALAVADSVLFPRAQDVDRGWAPIGDGLTALAGAGLFGIAGPVSHGGTDLGPNESRRVLAAVGSGCGATFFVWVQHHGVVRQLRASANTNLADPLLAPLCAGTSVAGVAFAHVRRHGPPAILATRTDGGWRLDGHAPWATSWGIASWFCVAAESADGELVWSMIPGDAPAGVIPTPLGLPVFASTGTVELAFDGCVVTESSVVAVEDADRWRQADRRRTAVGQPAVMGVADRAIRLLDDIGDDDATGAAMRLREELDRRWADDVALTDGEGDVAAASEHRAACLGLASRATTALLAASGGRGMALDHPAQRLAREATFYVIQAQTADGRAATLRSV
jgi:alkylation response protein AidB-like acyl-CoA dehydrogenase